MWVSRLWTHLGISRQCCRTPAQASNHGHELDDGSRLHLSHHPGSVRLDGDLGDTEFAPYLLVQPAGDDEAHDLSFATGERGIAFVKHLHLRQVVE